MESMLVGPPLVPDGWEEVVYPVGGLLGEEPGMVATLPAQAVPRLQQHPRLTLQGYLTLTTLHSVN